MSCLDVEPAENAALIKAAKDPRDGLIRIQTFIWVSFSTMVLGSTAGMFQWQNPVSVTSNRSILFTFSQHTSMNNMNDLRSGFKHC